MTDVPYIREYIQHAKRANRTDISLSLTCYISAAIMYFYSILVDGVKYVPLLQFFAMALLVVGIYVNQRYSWTNYIYMIRSCENKHTGEITGFNFSVHRVQGKRSSCLADIPCADIIAFEECTSKSKVPEIVKSNKNVSRYSFTQTMMPARFHTAVFNADGGIAAIAFEPDEALAEMLASCVNCKKIENETDDQ